MEKTARNHFGGGDTAWEESRLGSYARSETRLLEILEGVCEGVSKEAACHAMVEEHEENIEKFWFDKHHELSELEPFMCIIEMKVCCPEGKFGKDCQACPGGADSPCNGRGKCKGAGTRGGNGKCVCDNEYQGETCEECSDEYYDTGNKTCKKCHESCASSCSDGTNKGCDDCKDGYVEDTDQACVDKNECEDTDICKEGTFCFNIKGSFRCHDCDPACDGGCTGSGRRSCVNCKAGWKQLEDGNGCEDINECDGEITCQVGTFCKNTEGSHECQSCHVSCHGGCTGEGPGACKECAEGYKWSDEGCADVDECLENKVTCPSGKVCVNKDGPDSCEACHSSCIECVNTEPSGCLQCQAGYKLTEGVCEDVNECTTNPCNKKTETCSNTPGSYRCKCKKGFVRTKTGDCVKKGKKTKKEKSIEHDIEQGRFLTEKQLKIGSLLYAVFFGLIYVLFKRGRYYSIAFLVLLHGILVAYVNLKFKA